MKRFRVTTYLTSKGLKRYQYRLLEDFYVYSEKFEKLSKFRCLWRRWYLNSQTYFCFRFNAYRNASRNLYQSSYQLLDWSDLTTLLAIVAQIFKSCQPIHVSFFIKQISNIHSFVDYNWRLLTASHLESSLLIITLIFSRDWISWFTMLFEDIEKLQIPKGVGVQTSLADQFTCT